MTARNSSPSRVQSVDASPISNTDLASEGIGKPLPLSPAQRRQRQQAAVKHGVYAVQSAAKRRRQKMRGKVTRLRRAFPHLKNRPSELLYDYAEAHTLRVMAAVELMDGGIVNGDGDVRRLFADYRLLLGECHRLAVTLGIIDDADEGPLASLMNGGAR